MTLTTTTTIMIQKSETDADLPKKCIPLSNMLQYNLEPKPGVVKEERKEFDHHKASKKINQNQEFMESVQKAKQNASTVKIEEPFAGDNVEIVTLGTGSSIPSKYRNGKVKLFVYCDTKGLLLLVLDPELFLLSFFWVLALLLNNFVMIYI